MVHEILRALNLEAERVRLSWVSASERGRFQQLIEDFDEELNKLGRNPTRDEVLL